MTPEKVPPRVDQVRARIGNHLTNVMNLPKPMQVAALGTDMHDLIEALTSIVAEEFEHVWDEGFTSGFYDPLGGASSARDASESDRPNPYERRLRPEAGEQRG